MMRQPASSQRHRMTYSRSSQRDRLMLTAAAEARQRDMPMDEVLGLMQVEDQRRRRHQERRTELASERPLSAAVGGPSRRHVLAGAGAAVGLAVSPQAVVAAYGETAPRIAIVGGGLAGIRCAHRLWTAGPGTAMKSTVYEWDTSHVGGRCWSLRNYFSNGMVAERGGAYINTEQTAIRNLINELGLKLQRSNSASGESIFRFDDAPYTYSEANEFWGREAYDIFRDTRIAASWPTRYNSYTQEALRLDQLSIPEWLDETGIGCSSKFGRLMLADAVAEYGGDPGDQSALNLIYLLGWNSQSSLSPLAGADERYQVAGGADQIITRMVDQLPQGTVKQGYRLLALKDNLNATYTLTFETCGRRVDVVADHMVLALPFVNLRDVDLTKANLPELKLRAINEAAVGHHAKIHIELRQKTWPQLGYSGDTYTDWHGFCSAWDASQHLGPHGAPALLVGYPGGSTGRDVLTGTAHGPAPAADVTWLLDQIEPIFPGTHHAYSGRAYEDHWSASPFSKGAYSYWRPRQQTSWVGVEADPVGNVHFAGEHTEPAHQGYLNGAVVSGERVARTITMQT